MKNISVIVPSYNRAHLLKYTLPTYLQENVGELILVDDCSSDDTSQVVKELQRQYPEIRYYRMEKNSRQPAARNKGLNLAKYPYVYFGDDDSILIKDCMKFLLETLVAYNADGVAAKALYMHSKEDISNLESFIHKNTIFVSDPLKIVNLSSLKTGFRFSIKTPVRVPITPACILIKRETAQRIKFDENYIGNAYREETDFTIRASMAGAKIYYDSRAIQVNYPPDIVGKSGANSWSRLKWYKFSFVNNNYFLKKNYQKMRKIYDLPYPMWIMKLIFIKKMLLNGFMYFSLEFAKKLHCDLFLRRILKYIRRIYN